MTTDQLIQDMKNLSFGKKLKGNQNEKNRGVVDQAKKERVRRIGDSPINGMGKETKGFGKN